MKPFIAKLRLIGVITLAAFIFLLVFEKNKLANIALVFSLLSFALVVILQVYSISKGATIKNYFRQNEEVEN